MDTGTIVLVLIFLTGAVGTSIGALFGVLYRNRTSV